MDKNIYAAIAMALYEYQGNNVHDKEPGFIHTAASDYVERQVLKFNSKTIKKK